MNPSDDAEGRWEYMAHGGEGAHEALCDGGGVVQVYMMHAIDGLDDPRWRLKCTMRRIDGVDDPQW